MTVVLSSSPANSRSVRSMLIRPWASTASSKVLAARARCSSRPISPRFTFSMVSVAICSNASGVNTSMQPSLPEGEVAAGFEPRAKR